jgi:hypothetical protein
MPEHRWIAEVLADIHDYALKNNLLDLSLCVVEARRIAERDFLPPASESSVILFPLARRQ